MAKKYPPTSKETIKDADKIKNFKLKPLPDLLNGCYYSKVKQFEELVEILNTRAHQYKDEFK